MLFNLAFAIPARPGLFTVTQSDGTTLQIQNFGDEFFHRTVTVDMLTIAKGDDGDMYYVTPKGLTDMRAHDPGTRNQAETQFVAVNKDNLSMLTHYKEAEKVPGRLSALRQAPPKLATQVPNNGSPRVPIILVEYQDKSMKNTKAQFESHYKTDAKSVYQYFVDQSNGLYTPQFDLYGIYLLPSNRATYGGNDSSGDDKGVAKMVGDAITKAGNDIDWSQYDNNGDGEVDVCIVVYAGVGEAQSNVANSVWPCQWSLSNAANYGDGSGAVTRNGKKIDKFAVFNEINGSNDNGSTMDGIGTFCHEYSHCLGLPDFYETTYNYGYYGMDYWSLMNTGCYNGLTIDGDTPIGYSAYEKNFMGWINYITPQENTQYTLPVFNSKNAANDQAIKITALNNNEYWILENRKKQGWDQCIQDEGVLITHFTYVASRWDANTVNNQTVQLATIIPADNRLSTSTNNADLFGETNHAFGPSTTPAMKANMSASGSLSNSTGGAGTVNKPVTEITLNNDGSASLWYIKGADPSISTNLTSLTFGDVEAGTTKQMTFTVTGSNLTSNITVAKTGNNFSVSPTSISKGNGSATATVTVTFSPTAGQTQNYTGTVTLTCGSVTKTVSLTGRGVYTPPTITVNPTSLTFNGYVGQTYTQTINVKGANLTGNITVAKSGNGIYSVSPTTITASQAMSSNGVNVTVTYAPTAAGNTSATLTLSSSGADNLTVAVNGTAQAATPTLIVNNTNLTFNGKPGKAETKTISLTGRFVTGNVTVTLNDPNNVFTLSSNAANAPMRSNGMAKSLAIVKAEELAANQSTSRDQKVKRASTREKAGTQVSNSRMANMNGVPARVPRTASGSITIPGSSISETTPVNIGVTFNAAEEGNYTGSITIAANGAETVTVPLRAEANDGGTASDAYLDIAKYATIDDAGWRGGYFDNLYKYTENTADGVGWLTLPVYGAWASWNYEKSSGTANGNGPQRWITSSSYTGDINGNETWNASSPFVGSSVYFTTKTAKYFGNTTNAQAGSVRTITFYVTNTTAVKLYGKNSSNNTMSNSYRCSMAITQVDENLNQIETVTTQYGSTNRTATVNLSYNLEANKIYKVVVSTIRTHLYEIAFATPLPSLTADPSSLSFTADQGETVTKSFTLKGVKLSEDITATITGANGEFSAPATISASDAMASSGATVNVSFTAPQEYGTYTGTLTLTSGTVSQTVNLYGTVAEKGAAQGEYLDIAKYATIGEPDGWYSSSFANPYKYDVYPSELSAWLTVPASIAYIGYDEGNQGWVGLNQYGNPYWYGHQWSATDVFAGHEYFKCDELTDADGDYAYMLGPNVSSSSAATTNTYMFYGMYFVTNCTKVKSYGYNNSGASSNYPSFIMIYEMTEGADGTLTQAENAFDVQTYGTANTQYVLESAELDPNKIYFVAVGGYRGDIYEVAFRTPMEGLPGVPEIVSVDPTATTADVDWTEGENNETWNLRYREYVDPEEAIAFFDDFENGLGNWTIYTDGTAPQTDGWTITSNGQLTGVNAVSGSNMASAWSWSSVAYNANNWLITPQVTFGKELSFWVRTAGSWPDSYEVLLSTRDNAERSFTVTLQAMATAPTNNEWNQVVIDLSEYEGQSGYIAIHHVSEDCNYLLIDDFGIYNSGFGEWNYVYDLDDTEHQITSLTPETTYEVQVQGVNDLSTSDWTESTIFTTLAEAPITLAELVATGVQNQSYSIVDGDLTCVKVLDVEGGAMLLCKDDNKLAEASRDVNNGAIDYMANIGNEIVNTEVGITDANVKGANYDQSNWVALYLPSSVGSFSISGGSLLTKVKGVYTDNVNHTIELTAVPVVSKANAYAYNVFIPVAFRGTQTSSVHNNDYFFVQPEPMEVAWITWAVWDGSKFVMPAMEYGNNQANLQGQFFVNCSLLETNGYDLSSLSQNEAYSFIALMKKEAATGSVGKSTAPRRADGDDGGLVAYAISVPQSLGDVVTGVNELVVGRNVKSVTYYNVHGQASMTPFSGLNMVEVRYTDGTRRVVKIMK